MILQESHNFVVKDSRDIIAEDHREARSAQRLKSKQLKTWFRKTEFLFFQSLKYFQEQNRHGKLISLGSVQTNDGDRQGKGSVWQEGSLSAVVQKQFTKQLVCARQHVSITDTLKNKT